MKLLPCRPTEGKGCQGLATLPDGTPQRIGRAPDFYGREPFRYKCATCKLVTALRPEDYARLPEATLQQLRDHELGWMVENDLRGQGATDQEIEGLGKEESLERGVGRLQRSIRARRA